MLTIIRVVVALATLGLTSYVGGLLAYVVALRAVFHEAAAGDLSAVVYWSAWLYAPFVVLILWPWLLRLSANFGDTRRFVVYPLAGATAGFIPVVAFGAVWRTRTVISPEIFLFAILFSTAAALFGIGYALAWNWVHR